MIAPDSFSEKFRNLSRYLKFRNEKTTPLDYQNLKEVKDFLSPESISDVIKIYSRDLKWLNIAK